MSKAVKIKELGFKELLTELNPTIEWNYLPDHFPIKRSHELAQYTDIMVLVDDEARHTGQKVQVTEPYTVTDEDDLYVYFTRVKTK